jgi:hypothetical protein
MTEIVTDACLALIQRCRRIVKAILFWSLRVRLILATAAPIGSLGTCSGRAGAIYVVTIGCRWRSRGYPIAVCVICGFTREDVADEIQPKRIHEADRVVPRIAIPVKTLRVAGAIAPKVGVHAHPSSLVAGVLPERSMAVGAFRIQVKLRVVVSVVIYSGSNCIVVAVR